MMTSQRGTEKLNLLFRFGEHGTAEDAAKLRRTIGEFKPHVLIPEAFNRLEGKQNFPEFKEHASDVLEKYATQHRLFDLENLAPRKRRELEAMHDVYKKAMGTATIRFFIGKPQNAIDDFMRAISAYAQLQTSRQRHLNKRVVTIYQKLIRKKPELAKQPELRVLFMYGALHIPIYHAAVKAGLNAQMQIETPLIFTGLNRVASQLMSNHNLKLSDEEMARALVQEVIAGQITKVAQNQNTASLCANFITRNFTLEQFNRISIGLSNTRGKGNVQERLRQVFKQEGITLPETAEQLKQIMKAAKTQRVA